MFLDIYFETISIEYFPNKLCQIAHIVFQNASYLLLLLYGFELPPSHFCADVMTSYCHKVDVKQMSTLLTHWPLGNLNEILDM